ncbi:MAG: PAS domain S-box protein [Candidatus Tectomicrobia bacterium]|uniref:histidine kinase n=1 Tax=Tectimicrobiota bacterium TaxID=2528274 RepID=A0A932FVI7_UNCTE|nr:PAS domain S-box protein [Candidatus Tectomicrobia bacterium]
MKQDHTGFKRISDHLAILGIGLGVLYWFLESAMDAFTFRMGDWGERMLAPDANELWMRVLVIGILLLFSFYAQSMLSERKRVNEVLHERTAMFQGLFESAPDAILVVNSQGRIVRVNRQAERMFGYLREALLGQSIETLLPERFREQHGEHCANYCAEPRIHPMGADGEIYGRNKVGSEFPVDIMLSHLETSEGRVVLSVVRDITERKRAEEALREYAERLQTLSHRLVEVQEAERRHLARELHDEIGQLLTGLKLTLEMSLRLSADAYQASLREAEALVQDLMGRVRQLSLDLRPAMLDDLGLLPTLLWHFERYTDQTRIRVVFRHIGLDGRRFSSGVETTTYRLVQEALTNVARHAGVSEVNVRLWADQEMLSVQIEDRGGGFDPEATLSAHLSSGLAGMRERVRLLGGHLTVESTPGKRTCVTVELPLDQPTDLRTRRTEHAHYRVGG